MTQEEQLKLWEEGTPEHDDESDRCCPDFSCCEPDLLATKEMREAFCRAYRSRNYGALERMTVEFTASLLGKSLGTGVTVVHGNLTIH